MPSGARQLKRAFFFWALLLALPGLGGAEPTLRQRSELIWSLDKVWFGGFSGAEVDAAGTDLTLITDRGFVVMTRLSRKQGQITAIDVTDAHGLRGRDGRKLTDPRNDAEGLAIGPGGPFVSFERAHRVLRMNPATGALSANAQSPDFRNFILNQGLEALAVDAAGTLWAVPEAHDDENRFAVYAKPPDADWRIDGYLPRTGPFRPVGADIGPDGWLYLLERAVTPLGFRSRISRLNIDARPLSPHTLLTTGPGQFDNLEAITVWRDPAGQTRLIVVSDDNFLPVQRTQIVEFVLSQ